MTDEAATPTEPVVLRWEGACALISLNRPHRLNAVSTDLYRGLIAALDRAAASDARVVVLSGAGRAFCAGADLKAHSDGRTPSEQEQYVRLATEACTRLGETPQPVIAAVHGYAIGAGAELAINCDMVVAASDAAFSFPEASLATYVGGGVTDLLPRLVGLARATELLMLGRRFTGEDAVTFGIATAAVREDELTKTVKSLAAELAAQGPLSLRELKRDLRRPPRPSGEAAAAEERTLLELMQSADWREGVAAFAEGRAADYHGR